MFQNPEDASDSNLNNPEDSVINSEGNVTNSEFKNNPDIPENINKQIDNQKIIQKEVNQAEYIEYKQQNDNIKEEQDSHYSWIILGSISLPGVYYVVKFFYMYKKEKISIELHEQININFIKYLEKLEKGLTEGKFTYSKYTHTFKEFIEKYCNKKSSSIFESLISESIIAEPDFIISLSKEIQKWISNNLKEYEKIINIKETDNVKFIQILYIILIIINIIQNKGSPLTNDSIINNFIDKAFLQFYNSAIIDQISFKEYQEKINDFINTFMNNLLQSLLKIIVNYENKDMKFVDIIDKVINLILEKIKSFTEDNIIQLIINIFKTPETIQILYDEIKQNAKKI